MDAVLLIIHLVVAAALIGLVLIQQGKGADMGAAFGAGASQTVFGATGSGNFLSRATAILATIFFITSLVLAYFSGKVAQNDSVVDQLADPAAITAPAAEDIPAAPADKPVSELPPE